jgi:hypothetical protein
VLAENRAQLARYLERALFTQGFEVALVSGGGISAERLGQLLTLSQSAGLVLIYSTDGISPEERAALRELASLRTFDLAAMNLPADDHAAVSAAVAALRSLRMDVAAAPGSEVNG